MVIAILVVSLLAGCGQTKDGNKDGKTQGENDPITFTVYIADPNSNAENFESPVAQKIKEATGVTLDVEYLVGDNKQKVALMATSGQYPDIVFAKGESNILIEAGAFIDLTDLIEKYGPNLKKLYGEYMPRLRYSLEDPSIYTLGSYGVREERFEPSAGFQLQHAVVKELGYPEIKTVKDYENAIKQYMEKHPTIDGQPTIGVSLLADGWRTLITVTNPAAAATGQNGDDGEWFVDQETLKPVIHNTRPEEKEYYRWLNHMYNIGLLDPDSFTQKYDAYEAKIASGRVLGLIDAPWQYGNAQTTLRRDGKEERMYGIYPVTLSEEFENKDFMSGGYSAGWGVGITTSCKDPVRAIKFLDWLASDEAQILNNWGIEGVHYTVDENGKRVIPEEEWEKRRSDPEYGKKTGIGVYTYPFPQRGTGEKDPTGQYYVPTTPEQIKANYTDIEREVLSAYGVEMWKDLFKPASEFPIKPYGVAWQISIPQSSNINQIMQRLQDITFKRIPAMIMAKPSEFDRLWDEYQKEMEEAGVHEAEKEFEQLLKDKVKLWNQK